ncbi:MAG TPA: maleylpyruvate isomerase family mycothiol-dependent enzyme [Actinomycetota bacterium]|nr:maleylpyruvate isomerase family mycothiol-dependent enzyme [Actinomycetota bacterium]
MSDYVASYVGARERISELARGAGEDELQLKVPACPDWTVRELVSHLVGVATDSVAGEIENLGNESWTTKHLEDRKGRSIDELIAEWEKAAVTLDAALADIHPALAGGLIGDVITHEHDLRGALDKPGARDMDLLELPIYTYVRWFGTRVKKAGLDPVEVESGDKSWIAGAGEAGPRVTADPFDLLRSLTGRRTRLEVKDLKWEGDPEPYLEVFSSYTYARSPLNE